MSETTAATLMPKRSTIPIVCSFAWMALWLVLSALRAEPNDGLVRHLGAEGWEAFVDASPAAAELLAVVLRTQAVFGLALVVLGLAVTLTAYRARARWAWSALWVWPVAMIAAFVVDTTGFPSADTPVGTFGPVFLIAAVPTIVGLLLGAGSRRAATDVPPRVETADPRV